MLKRITLVGLLIPMGLLGSWLLAEASGLGGGVTLATTTPLGIGSVLGGDLDHDLRRLSILERDLFIIKQRYVEKERLAPDEMFAAALEAVERDVPEVMFVWEVGGDRLHISVGAYSTLLPIQAIDDLDDLYTQLSQVAAILDQHLSEEIDRAGVEYAIINGALSTLDPHSVLLPPVAAKEMEVDNQGEFGGLGIEITTSDGWLTVKQPMPDSPAAAVGLQANDHIIRIEDESTINMDLTEAVSKLRGEVGTSVAIHVMRKGRSRPIPMTITRAVIRVNPVEGELLEGNIGYIEIKTFHASVASDLDDLLSRFGRESSGQLRGLILDLRGNPGGYLNQAIEVCDRFLEEGVIVSTVEDAERRRDETRAVRDGDEPSYPIAVLVNGSSASASEIVAGALRNQGRAIILGERTFGKGSVQHLYNHRDNSRLKLTVAQYLTPGDRSIQSIGIPPDILLQPSVIRAREDEENPVVSLYWREWLDREASLDHHLAHASTSLEAEISYRLRYLREEGGDLNHTIIDPNADWEVKLAQEILLASPGSRRADVIQAAAPVVARHSEEQRVRIEQSFSSLGIDWSAPTGEQVLDGALSVRLDLGEDGVLVAGEEEQIALEVTNTGPVPIYQLSAVTASDNPSVDTREFYFGRIDPGETRRYEQKVVLPQGYGDEVTPITITFRDPASPSLWVATELIQTRGKPLPRFAYQLRLVDDGSGESMGDGDGLPEVGEVVEIELTVWNEGEGPSGEAFARLKNRSGRAVDLKNGIIELGMPRTAAGEACEPDTEGCTRTLAPGEEQVARFTFEIREEAEDGAWDLELLLGDNRAYDYTTISRGGFFDYFQLNEKIALQPDATMETLTRHAPVIEVTRQPLSHADEAQMVISGIVRDDRGVRDVMIFHNEDKVFFRGGSEGGAELPYTVERELLPGLNHLYILARDYQGLSATYAVSSWFSGEDAVQQAAVVPREELDR